MQTVGPQPLVPTHPRECPHWSTTSTPLPPARASHKRNQRGGDPKLVLRPAVFGRLCRYAGWGEPVGQRPVKVRASCTWYSTGQCVLSGTRKRACVPGFSPVVCKVWRPRPGLCCEDANAVLRAARGLLSGSKKNSEAGSGETSGCSLSCPGDQVALCSRLQVCVVVCVTV